jgi:hypothetical protein
VWWSLESILLHDAVFFDTAGDGFAEFVKELRLAQVGVYNQLSFVLV